MKTVFALTIFLAAALAVYGQPAPAQPSQCSLKLAQSPAVRGIKLGMKTADVLAMFPGSADQDGIRNALSKVEGYPHFGVISINISPSMYSTKERFSGIVDYSLLFVDGGVGEYRVQYIPPPSGPKWQRVDDFVTRVAEAYNLPSAASWAADSNINYEKTLKCDGFQVKASTLMYQGILTVSKTEAPWRIQLERRAAFEENIRREFKP
jgi:hypothetical protein